MTMVTTAFVIAGGAAVLGAGALAMWHFLRDNFDEKRSRVGDAQHQQW